MKKEELKKYVDEYFKRYMCAETLDKFIENWEETENWCEYFRKENEQLKSIIKEVREYIKSMTLYKNNKCDTGMKDYQCTHLLEILDKVEENK